MSIEKLFAIGYGIFSVLSLLSLTLLQYSGKFGIDGLAFGLCFIMVVVVFLVAVYGIANRTSTQ